MKIKTKNKTKNNTPPTEITENKFINKLVHFSTYSPPAAHQKQRTTCSGQKGQTNIKK